MEKFSQWRDPGTGIAVFVPAANAYSPKSPAVEWAEVVIVTAMRLAKLPLVLACLFVHLILAYTPLAKFSLRALLLVCGVSSIKLVDDRRNNKRPKDGDVIVANHTSPLDGLALATMFNCMFVLPGENGEFATVSALGVAFNALSFPSKRPTQQFEKIMSTAKQNESIVVVFAEGLTSNGRGLLPMATVPMSLAPKSTIFPVAMKYTHPSVITAIPVNFFVWVWRLLGVVVNVNIKLASPVAATGDDNKLMKEIGDGICRVGRVRQVGDYLNEESKREFVVAWNKYHK